MRSGRMRLLVASVVIAVTATASSAVAAADPMTIELIGKRTLFTLPATPAVGGTFLSGGDLFDTAAAKVGRAVSSCDIAEVGVTVPPVVLAHCDTVFRLKDGDLHFGSLREYSLNEFKDTTFAVTGGTGAFKEARGEATVTGGPEPGTRKFVITLTS